ncbi:MAG: hypothetical protein MUD02_04070 [Bacteroidales bacterium]|nr:hypothetical protein [Bacteroidales bacterium]
MKRVFFATVMLAALSAATFARELVAEGKTNTSVGDYKIEVADNPVTINGESCKTYVISYKNSPMEVQVAVKKEKGCQKYIVLSDKLSVQYVCNPNYFGVEKLDKSFEKDGLATSDESLNRSEYFHQKVITSGNGCEKDNTMLIAAYFPKLVN